MSRSRNIPVLADVARLAGVAPITVSRVVNGHPSVTAETRARVQRAIDELGYRSNMAARTLAGGRSRVLGVISVETELYGPATVLFGIEAAAREAGHIVSFVRVPDPTVAALRRGFDHLAGAHAEGVIVIASGKKALHALSALEPTVPLVVNTHSDVSRSTVNIDAALGARLATAHLLDLGHRTVHHIRGERGSVVTDARAEGWRRELRARKAPVPRALTGDWTARSGYEAGQRLAADPTVTAVVAANDPMALGLISALREAGRTVPGDVSVVGFDDTPESEFYDPPLTTVRMDLQEIGRRSVGLLLDVVNGGGAEEHVVIEQTLVVRSSTAPPPAGAI